MRIICLAYHLIGSMGLQYFLGRPDDEVVAVFTHEDAPGESIWWPSVAELARERSIPTFTPQDINTNRWAATIRDLQPDFIFSFWYRVLVKRAILQIPPSGCLNMHGSLLPRYRGRAPVNWALVNGEQQTGVTLHYMVPGADAGDIVGQAIVPIELDDTAQTLYERLVVAGEDVLARAWPLLREGRAPRLPQDHTQATYVGRRTPEDGRFEWSWPALRIHNLVRAVTHPYPGAFTTWREGRLFVWETHPLPGRLLPEPEQPGTILEVGERGLRIATGAGDLLVRRLQTDGQVELDGEAFARGNRVQVGERLS